MFKVGIIGAGHIAEKMANTLNAMDDAAAYAVASRSLEKAEAFAGRFGIPVVYGSYGELASDPEVDLVYVATPHSLHYEHIRMCLEHGRAVLCEKAFTANAREAEELIRLSREKGVFLAEAIWPRYMPFRQTIKELAFSGRIGEPKLLTANLGYVIAHKERIQRPELGGGALLDIGVYAINFALMNFGDRIASVSGSCMKSETGMDMHDTIRFSYEDGKVAMLYCTALCATDRQGMIGGDNGYLVVDNINNPLKADIYDAAHKYVETVHAPQQITGFEYQVRACMEAISKGRIEPEAMPHSEILRVMQLMDRLRRDWGVVFPLNDR